MKLPKELQEKKKGKKVICDKCGKEAYYDEDNEIGVCNHCKSSWMSIKKFKEFMPDFSKPLKMPSKEQIKEIFDDAYQKFFCSIKEKEVCFLECFQCFEPANLDGTCDIMQNEMELRKPEGGSN